MATTLRQPFKLASLITSTSKQGFRPAQLARAFHAQPIQAAAARPSIKRILPSGPSSHAFRGARTYMQPPARYAQPESNLGRRLLVGGAAVAGAAVALNLVFNRETREDGGMPPFERAYLNDTFLHTGLGIGIIATSATAMWRSGFAYRIMATNPWVVAIGGLALSFGTMIATRSTNPENYMQKYALWTAFNATQAAFIAPMLFMAPPAIIARAGLYTVAMMSSIAFVGATAKQEKYLYLGGPLLAGLAVVMVSGFAPLVLPVTAVRTLAFTENIWLYGGLAVFGGITLYDVQKILYHARLAERGLMAKDPVNESISLELDFLNIFIRMVQILGMQQRKR